MLINMNSLLVIITPVGQKPVTSLFCWSNVHFTNRVKGVGKGLGGLLAKPVTGIVDATSTAFQGVQTQLDVKEYVRRLRYPRVVDESPLEPYKFRLAYAQKLLRSLDEEFLNHRDLIGTSEFNNTQLGNETPIGLGYTNRNRNRNLTSRNRTFFTLIADKNLMTELK